MAESPAQIRIRDPLSEVTRNERRFLLGISIISIALVRTGLVPSKISALGIEFSQADQKSLLSILALITLYFLVAFILYASSDFVAWRLAFLETSKQWASDLEALPRFRSATTEEERKVVTEEERKVEFFMRYAARSWNVSRLGFSVSFLRAMFEFLLPIVVGIYATALLLKAPPPLQQEHQNAPVIVLPHDTMNMNSDAPIQLFP